MPTVFLSYAHDDNRVPEGLKGSGWVSFFDNSLRIELDERGMIDVKVWRDKRDFDTMELVVDALDSGVTNSDVFMPVVSPLYVRKQYTMFELDRFVKHKSGTGGDARRNILMVLKRPVPEDQYPQAIRGVGYIPFFEIDREKGHDEPFFKGYASTAPSDKYWDAIREVAKNLQQFFAELAEAAKQRGQQAAAGSGITVYLAHPSGDLRDAHWSLRKELEAQGCRIVPGEPWPANPAAAEKHLRDALAAAQFSIHLLGATSGSDQGSGLSGLAALQLDLAAQRADPGFRRLIWLPDRLAPAEAAQQQLIESLGKGDGLRAQDEFVRAGAEGFKEVVRDELARLAGTAAKPARVYLICDAVDEAEALALRPRLVEAGFEVELPEFGPGGTVPAEEHQRCLAGCETILLYWGQITESRIRMRLEEIEGAVGGLRQGTRFAARGLYLAPPPSTRKANFASNYIDVILRDPGEFKLLRAPKASRAGP